ncbi:MAG: DUF433 domain-containing protein [Chloroflexi bacterium]|nr:DUF433 domain-containing protein [Chloroflexota bacterium]
MSKLITSDPQILGGAAIITGTRLPVVVVLQRLKEGFTIDEIHDQYPHVSTKTFAGVLEELAEPYVPKAQAL